MSDLNDPPEQHVLPDLNLPVVEKDGTSSAPATASSVEDPNLRRAEETLHVGPTTSLHEKLWFKPETYPLNTPVFEHLIFSSAWLQPTNFERFISANRALPHLPTVFRPEPALLSSIQTKMFASLQMFGMPPGTARVLRKRVPEANFLRPPTEPVKGANDRLGIPGRHLRMLRRTISVRLKTHSMSAPKLFHLKTVVDGHTRHVLMLSAQPGYYFDVKGRGVQSSFWLLFEGMEQRKSLGGSEDHLAFLGAMFLPKDAKKVLLDAKVLKVAFPGFLRLQGLRQIGVVPPM